MAFVAETLIVLGGEIFVFVVLFIAVDKGMLPLWIAAVLGALSIGVGFVLRHRMGRERKTSVVDFFETQSELNKANGSLGAELEHAQDVYAIWPAGGYAQTLGAASLKHIKRLIVRDPNVSDEELKFYARQFDAFDCDEVRSAIRVLTGKATQAGVDVRWHRDPAVSIVINRESKKPWARIEHLLPRIASARRFNMRLYRARQPEAFKTIEDCFDRLWEESVAPSNVATVGPSVAPKPSIRPDTVPTRAEWHALEDRFALIGDELEALWTVYEDGQVTWSVHPVRGAKHPDRNRDRFIAEAQAGATLLQRMKYYSSDIPNAKLGVDIEDRWLMALSLEISPENDLSGEGIDNGRRSKSGAIDNVVHASKTLCAKLATRSQLAMPTA